MEKFRQLRRMLAGMLAAALILPWGITAEAAGYDDTEGHWAQATIEKWSVEYGVLGGYGDGTFRPDNPVTRGAFAGILSRFLKYTEEAPKDTFSDTAGNRWESDILKLNAAGVYLGNDGKAQIGSSITRQQALTMICRALQVPQTEGTLPYADSEAVAGHARGYLTTLTKRGCITDVGADNRFRPTEPITRAEVVNLLDQIIDSVVQEGKVFTSAVGGSLLLTGEEGLYLQNAVIGGDLIIGPGVTGRVTLQDVTLLGEVRSLGDAEVVSITTESPVYNHIQTELQYEGKTVPVQQNARPGDLSAADFYWENGRLVSTHPDYNIRFGIDVSQFQCYDAQGTYVPIDWNAVKEDGVEFVMVRIGARGYGAGGTLFADKHYAENIDGAMAAGLDTGVYFFSQAITVEEAVEEAELVIELLEGRNITGPVTYDWEMGTSDYRVYGIDPAMATACAKAFCQRIKAAGYDPMIYCSRYVGFFKYDLSALADYPVWYPEYKKPSTAAENLYPALYYHLDYWQYSDSLTIRGITGKVDGNLQFIPKPTYEYDGKTYSAREDVPASGLSAGDFVWDKDRLICTNPRYNTRFGIEVSQFQCYDALGNHVPIDWQAVKEDGVDFAMVRVGGRGYGAAGTLYTDLFYKENVDGAMAAGLETGVYFVSQAITEAEAVEEAERVIDLLGGRKLTGPVAYAWQMGDSTYRVYGIDPAVATACAVAFCQRIREAGYEPIIHCTRYVGYMKYDLSALKEYGLLYTEYADASESEPVPGFYYEMDYWQYSKSVQVKGIYGKVSGSLHICPTGREAGES